MKIKLIQKKHRLLSFAIIVLMLHFLNVCFAEESSPLLFGDVVYLDKDYPLVRHYTISKLNSDEVTIRVKGKTSDMDIAHTFPKGYGTKFPILGLYPNYKNTVEITDGEHTIITNITTDKLNYNYEGTTVHVDLLPEADPFNQDLYWLSTGDETYVLVAFDRLGDLRYFFQYRKHRYFGFRVFEENGIIYVRNNNNIFTLDGEIVSEVQTDTVYHHDGIPLHNGNHVYLVNSEWGKEDRVIEETASGKVVKDVKFGSLFRDIVKDKDELEILNRIIYDDENIFQKNGKDTQSDWAHANSLVYDKSSGIMYFSLRNQGVLAVDYKKWKLLWWMADNTLATKSHVSDGTYNFTDIKSLDKYRVQGDGASDGPKNQHALFLHKNGNLGMLDNNGDENRNPLGSRYVEYKISGRVGSWKATKEREYRDPRLYSRLRSDADFTGEGHLLLCWSAIRRIREVDLDSNEVLFDIEMVDRFYRMDKMPIYPYQDKSKKYAMDYNEKEGK